MIVTYNWLKEFVDFDFSAEELAHRLTMAGLEVDAMEKIGEGLDSVIVARLLSVDPHPEADRLTLCQVETGRETVQVVCGARNHKAGDLVALAQVGTVLPGDFKIKKSKIRGRESMGMLCSEKELGLSEESEGILILPPGLSLGMPAFEALGLKDVRFELGLTPNRGDCLSILGVAREVAAMAGRPLKKPETVLRETGEPIGSQTCVTVEEPELCPRYAARLIRGVTVGPSPEWLVRRIESVGMRSINNVVDVTNFILMELGHPLHAFDFSHLRGRRIVVKRAGEGEIFTTLDSQQRHLAGSDLVICDAEGPVALAGIMGGENSEVQPETTDILLESAYFDPLTIRRTGKRLGIHSESSHRFERGADVELVPFALDRASALIAEVAGGSIAPGRIDVYPRPAAAREIVISAERTGAVLGVPFTPSAISGLLQSIQLDAAPRPDGSVRVLVPPFRHDLEREIDLIEEVVRLNGYDRIPVTMPSGETVCSPRSGHREQVKRAREALVCAGFSEMVNYSFVAPSIWDRLGLFPDDPRRKAVALLNPLTEEQSVMRTTLVGSILESVSRNLAYRALDLRLFELRPVFSPVEGEELPVEKMRLSAAACGGREPVGWAQGRERIDFYDLKGVAENLLTTFRVENVAWVPDSGEPFLHPGKSCRIFKGDRLLGVLGEIHPGIQQAFEIDQPLFLLDLDLEALFEAAGPLKSFKPLSRFPDVYRDSAFLVDESVSAQDVFEVVGKACGKEVEETVLFDLYQGQGVPEGKKSLGVRVRYRSQERTLTDEEIGHMHGKIVQGLQKRLGAEIR